MNATVREVADPHPEAAGGSDPDVLLDRFRAAVAGVHDMASEYYTHDDREHSASEAAKFYDEIAERYREAAEAMELLDERLSDGGQLSAAWRGGG